jgi:hypothetical protein
MTLLHGVDGTVISELLKNKTQVPVMDTVLMVVVIIVITNVIKYVSKTHQ